MYPGEDILGEHLWRAVIPHNTLDRFMPWSGGLVLKAMGQQATSTDINIYLPTGGIEVRWGCNASIPLCF